jgi:hypothetical protein
MTLADLASSLWPLDHTDWFGEEVLWLDPCPASPAVRTLGRELQGTLEVMLGQAAEPLTLRVAGLRDPQRPRDQVQVHAQLVEPKAVLVKAAPAQLRVVPAEPHAHPDVLYLDVEVHRALDVDQHRLTAAVEQDMIRAELAVDERRGRARLDRTGQ